MKYDKREESRWSEQETFPVIESSNRFILVSHIIPALSYWPGVHACILPTYF